MFPRIGRPLWSGKKTQVCYENMAGKLHAGRRLRTEDMVSAGGQYDLELPGVRFDSDAATIKIFEEGTILVYGAKSRESMWRSLRPVLERLGVEAERDSLDVFLVVARADLGRRIRIHGDGLLRRLAESYDVCRDRGLPFPGIMMRKGGGTRNGLFAALYESGVVVCEGSSEEAVLDAVMEIRGIVAESETGRQGDADARARGAALFTVRAFWPRGLWRSGHGGAGGRTGRAGIHRYQD